MLKVASGLAIGAMLFSDRVEEHGKACKDLGPVYLWYDNKTRLMKTVQPAGQDGRRFFA